MQEGNFSGPDSIFEGERLISKVQGLIAKARSNNIPIFFIQHIGKKGDPDEAGTSGWQIHSSIVPFEGDVIVHKQTPDSFFKTTLKLELDSNGIEHLIIAGLQTEYCVDTTCRRAFSLGYRVTLVEDAHSTWDSDTLTARQIIDHHNATLGGWFVKLVKEVSVSF
jgi:nicotinamidase-related amidase